jgi:uncharacterized membrane protein
MALPKAFYNKEVKTRNLVTTITGVITLVLTILVGFGVITPAQQGDLQTQAFTIVDAVIAIWGAVTSIILMFKAEDA